jgi:ribosomal-protein-alanine N-acetyltransferase
MSSELITPRLRLVALNANELGLFLDNTTKLETSLGLPIARDIIDTNVTRAINMKLTKMAEINPALHDWFTYWLMVIREIPAGVGLIGFKGNPGADGKAEVGYGIAAAYRNRGYMTEALQALSPWAFTHPGCRVLTATTVSNPASEKVLQKAGWQKVRQNDKSSDWQLLK